MDWGVGMWNSCRKRLGGMRDIEENMGFDVWI